MPTPDLCEAILSQLQPRNGSQQPHIWGGTPFGKFANAVGAGDETPEANLAYIEALTFCIEAVEESRCTGNSLRNEYIPPRQDKKYMPQLKARYPGLSEDPDIRTVMKGFFPILRHERANPGFVARLRERFVGPVAEV